MQPSTPTSVRSETNIDEKRETLNVALRHGSVWVSLDRHVPGVVVPDEIDGEILVTLLFSRHFEEETEVSLSVSGVQQDLLFKGKTFTCFVPWAAIISMRSGDDWAFFSESVPSNVREHFDFEYFELLSEISPLKKTKVVGFQGPFVPQRMKKMVVTYRRVFPFPGVAIKAKSEFKVGWNGELTGCMTDVNSGCTETSPIKGVWNGRHWTMRRHFKHTWLEKEDGNLKCVEGAPYVVRYRGLIDEREGAFNLRGVWEISATGSGVETSGVWSAQLSPEDIP